VVGTAALILARNPNLSYLEVKDLILSTVDPLPDLMGKTVTGGRLNVFKALSAMSATPLALSTSSIGSSLGSEVVTVEIATSHLIRTSDPTEPDRKDLLLVRMYDVSQQPGQSHGFGGRIAQASVGAHVAGSVVNDFGHAVDAFFAQFVEQDETDWFSDVLFRHG
jgi:hypothetical protein